MADDRARFIALAEEIIARIQEAIGPAWWDDVRPLAEQLETIRRQINFPRWAYRDAPWPAFLVVDVYRNAELHGIAAEFAQTLLRTFENPEIAAYGLMLSRDPLAESYSQQALWLQEPGKPRSYTRGTAEVAVQTLRRWIRALKSGDATTSVDPREDLLAQADLVFALAYDLGCEFERLHGNRLLSFDRYQQIELNEKRARFIRTLRELAPTLQTSLTGCGEVISLLRRAAALALHLSQSTRSVDEELFFGVGEFPELNSIAEKGKSAVSAARAALAPDDPLELFVEGKIASPSALCPTCGKPAPIDEHGSLRCADCGNRAGTFGELWIDLQTGGPLSKEEAGDETLCELRHLTRERFGSFDAAALGKLRDWLVATHGLTREQVQVTPRTRLVELLKKADEEPPKSSTLAPIGTFSPAALAAMGGGSYKGNWGSGTGAPFVPKNSPIAPTLPKTPVPPPSAENTPPPVSVKKRSTAKGEGRDKLIAALTKYHDYADGSCLNQEPIGNNDLAALAGVTKSTASEFFRKEFEGHLKYRAICLDVGRLADSLKALNGEFAPHELYGRPLPDENGRDDE